ncbi:MAG: VWA domain-containing protein [Candidatus Schekmanbacteria bacterium]|nr:VWA domain-containing protein [Candidatus Schekmanbacteria bacterium]
MAWNSRFTVLGTFALGALLVACLDPPTAPQSGFSDPTDTQTRAIDVTIRSARLSGDRVELDVAVVNQDGTSIARLQPGNFFLYAATANLSSGEISLATSQSSERLHVSAAVVLDYSESIYPDVNLRGEMEAAAAAFIGLMGTADRGALLKFSEDIELLQAMTGSLDSVSAALSLPFKHPNLRSRLSDAILAGTGYLQGEANRRAVVVLSDGGENYSNATETAVIAAARQLGVAVYLIGLRSADFDEGYLQRIAAGTGGSYYTQAAVDAAAEAYRDASTIELVTYKLVATVAALDSGSEIAVTVSYNGLFDTARYILP